MDILGLIALAKSQKGESASKVFHFKGVKSATNLLPIQGEEGDVYKVEGDSYYAWDGANWADIGDILSVGEIEELISDLTSDVNDLKSSIIRETDVLQDGNTPIFYSIVKNEYVKINDGAFTPYNGWNRTDYIEVEAGKAFKYYVPNQLSYNVWYDENKTRISNFILYGGLLNGQFRGIIPPSGAKYVAISGAKADMDALKIWYRPAVIDDNAPSDEKTYSSQKIESVIIDLPKVFLPDEIYMTEGSEVSIYFDNVMLGNYDDFVIVTQINNINWTYQYAERFSMQPQIGDKGNYTILFIIRNKKTNEQLFRKEISLHVLENKTITGKKALFLGDSLTAAGYFPYEIEKNLSGDGLVSVGTLTAHPYFNDVAVTVNHEGRGGWSAKDYVSYASKGASINAFWNPSTSKFDFSYYLAQNSISIPDIVVIGLGTNGVENADDEVNAIIEIITSIRTASNSVPIVVTLITPPAMQDGWTSQTHGGSVNRFKRLQIALNEAYVANFYDQITGVYVSPAYINLDREHDFPYQMMACSTRNPYDVYRQTDNVHPAKYGYFKIADVHWGMIQHLLT